MDINLARTFLIVAETGSFIEAGRKLNITQSTVSARIKSLEDQLGQPMFARSKTGAVLTLAGAQFQKHAQAMVRVWQHALREIGLSEQHRDHLAVAAHLPLWDGFLMHWVAWMRQHIPDIAVSASSGTTPTLTQRLGEGTLDLAVMYRPAHPPGFITEPLFEEVFVQVAGGRAGRGTRDDYIFVDWGADFQSDHAAAFPEHSKPGLSLDLGTLGIDYLLQARGTAYFPYRIVKPHLQSGRLRVSRRVRRFTYPVAMVYPEERDEEAYEPILASLRREAARCGKAD
jgi:DNA-binding transcriptional LysR family regulator